MRQLKLGIALLCVIVFVVFPGVGLGESAVGGASADRQEEGVLLPKEDDWIPVAQAGRLSLTCNPATGFLTVTDGTTGRVYTSNPADYMTDKNAKGVNRTMLGSQLLLTVADAKGNQETINSMTESVEENGLEVYQLSDGIRMRYTFPNKGLMIPIEIRLQEGRLIARILMDQIVESEGGPYLLSVGLLPYFGAGGPDEEGYIVLPDGSGALMRFHNGKYKYGVYEKAVYGEDLYKAGRFESKTGYPIRFPVFGVHFEAEEAARESGFLAVVTQGDALASVNAWPARVRSSYTNAYFSFTRRGAQSTSMLDRTWAEKTFLKLADRPVEMDTVEVTYYFPEGGTGYVSLAVFLRGLLEGEDTAQNKNSDMLPVYIDTYISVKKLGYTLGIPHQKSSCLTSFEQAEEILETFGGSPVYMRLMGWDEEGAGAGAITYRYRPAAVAGGTKGLTGLLDKALETGGQVFLEADLAAYQKGTFRYTTFSSNAKAIDNKPILKPSYLLSTNEEDTSQPATYFLIPGLVSDAASRFLEALPEQVTGLSLPVVSDTPYSDYRGAGYDRQRTRDLFQEVLGEASSQYQLYGEYPGMYALSSASVVSDIPVESSGYDFFDESVPFAQLVLRTFLSYSTPSVNLSANPQSLFLKAIETGSSLKYTFFTADYAAVADTPLTKLYGGSYTAWEQEAIDMVRELGQVMEGLEGEDIIDHEWLSDCLVRVVYGDGTGFVINYGTAEASWEGREIPGQSYIKFETGGDSFE